MNACRAILVLMATSGGLVAQESAPVAIVNGEPVSRADFDALCQRRFQLGIRQVGTDQREYHRDVATVLIDDLLLKQFLRSNAPAVEKAEVDRQLAVLERALSGQKKTITDYCQETHQTRDQLRANVNAVMQWKAYASARLTDDALKKYFVDNKTFFDRATVRASHIVLRVPKSDPERLAAEKKLAALRQEIVSGKISFADAARKYSQCPSAPRGGDLGYIPRKGMVEEAFAKAAFAMAPGSVSEVIASDKAIRIVHVTDKRAGSAAFYEDPRIRADVKECAIEELRQQIVEDLRSKAKVEYRLP